MNKNIFTRWHVLTEISAYLFLLASMAVAIAAAASGKIIPSHYDFAGNVTAYGTAGFLIMLPLTGFLFCGTMSLIAHFFSYKGWSMPFSVNPAKEIPVYQCVSFMMVSLSFLYSAYIFTHTLLGSLGMGKIFMPLTVLFFVLVFADIILCAICAKKRNQ